MTMVLALLLSVIGADVFAQKGADSVWVDSVEVDSVALAEEFKSDYDSEEDKARNGQFDPVTLRHRLHEWEVWYL